MNFLSRFVPEGNTKGNLRLWYYLLTGKIDQHPETGERLPFTIRYNPWHRLYRLRFDEGESAGRELLFPPFYDPALHPRQITAPWAFLWGVGREVGSYFAGPELKEGDLVVDAGACPGDFSLLAAAAVGLSGRVVCLEADGYSAHYLRQVVELNGGANCDVCHLALAGRSGYLPTGDGDLGTKTSDAGCGGRIPATSYDDLIGKHDPQRLCRHVLKMDIEGAEMDVVPAVLAGNYQPDLWIIASYHPDRETGEPTHVRLAPMLTAAGYECSLGAHHHKILFARRCAP
ncbi:MAG: FkbM family methyltransferase [Lentisphaeria bacterium]|jgi:FkbM family methyltransferase|nr:FkbM family methyltransferase [Lentisphaeria bacterium]